MLAFIYQAGNVYLAAGLHESGCALAAHIDLEYKIGTKSEEKEGVWDYTFEHIATLMLGMKLNVGPNAEGPYLSEPCNGSVAVVSRPASGLYNRPGKVVSRPEFYNVLNNKL